MVTAGIRVIRNDFPKVIAALPKAIDEEVDDSGDDLSDTLSATIWRDTGLLSRVTTNHEEGTNHCEISVGYYLGQGFYSGFQEFGTRKQAARPIVRPTAHAFEPVYARNMSKAVEDACDV
jgi:HK97 gp10 family phage protein